MDASRQPAELATATTSLLGMTTEKLRVRFAAVEILKGITLHARRGQILAIIGPAGAGKTTYLRCLNRMLELDLDFRISGNVYLNVQSVYHMDVQVSALRRQVGMVFSVPIDLPMTICQNLTFGLSLERNSRSQC